MKIFKLSGPVFKVTLVLMVVSIVFCSAANSQTRKKKTKKAVPVSSVQADTSTEPSIISRASDYPSSDLFTQPTVVPAMGVKTTENDRDIQLAEMSKRIKQLETQVKDGYDERQKRLLMNLDILTKAEQRVESLRKQRFELIDKENQIQSRLSQIEIEIRPDTIERSVAIIGSLRPEELREAKRKSLDSERTNLQSLLQQVQASRAGLDVSVDKADQLVNKLHATLEVDMDRSLEIDKPQDQ